MSATPDAIMYAAAKTLRFQSPPHERPDDPEVLLLRWYRDGDEPMNLWRFPIVGEFGRRGDAEAWTEAVDLVRLDASFQPPVPSADFQWIHPDFVIHCSRPEILHPNVRPAVRRLGGPLLDQVLACAEALADSNSHAGDSEMATSTAELQRQVAELQRRIGPPAGDPQEFRQAQAKADRVFRAIGDSTGAPPFMSGERLLDYRCRLLTPLQKFSAQFKSSNLYKIGDPTALSAIEDAIYNDALTAIRDPQNYAPGELRAIKRQDATGRELTSYVGHEGSCWDQFNPPVRHVVRFNTGR
jgi:hypothetical protein